ncbi:5'-methylthioadenosine phosphorylase [candidate division MSBL1 archaeon SCGC-AAA382A03]|uniref:Probable 6-oxopurine nucleoside phosphorylase n=1 Tax=candidate division MSBL1 archaeon SCGC-AAA382A03 TaxID=1698278 RepID=A0A133VGA2_9EURY|nr:5'-methylthioadenosine phosphorylase [candidate division MSBL1 archaeon SCGC-AAA382A03]
MVVIGIIGGSGVYSVDFIKNTEKRIVETSYGKSPEIVTGEVEGRKIAFMPRHGEGHSTPPHKINFRANLWALKELGVDRILATTAVGSLNPSVGPGEFVLLDQFIDFTKNRDYTFYEGDERGVVHIDVTNPYCCELRDVLYRKARELEFPVHFSGTYACTEGPRFETAAEIQMLNQLGADVVGMTNVPECVLARELEICYSTISIITNYAAGISENKLTHDEVSEIMDENINKVKKLVFSTIPEIPKKRSCECGSAIEGAKAEV